MNAEKEKWIKEGMERAAVVVENLVPVGQFSCVARSIRTVAAGGNPCEDCGYPLPQHDPSCVSRHLYRERDH